MRELYIRVDMNKIVATGHVMRCLSIADAAVEEGIKVCFILADSNAVDLVIARGYESIVLDSKWDNLDYEIQQMSDLIVDKHIDQLLIDSYYVTDMYLTELSKITETIYIDDINAFDYPVHTLICYANYYKKFHYENTKYKYRKHLLGMKYVPLRKEFRYLQRKKISGKIQKVLILTGGSDNFGIMKGILENLTGDFDNSLEIEAICGRYNLDYDELLEKYSDNPSVHIHKAVENIIDYMLDADLAISAGGTTLYELCACGVPTITYSFADNQLDNVKQFEEDGLMKYSGDVRFDDIYENIKMLLTSADFQEKREEWSNREFFCANGCGSEQIVRNL